MPKATRQLNFGDVIELEIDGTRVLCEVVRKPQRIVMPQGNMTFWVVQRETNDLHMVSAPPEQEFEAPANHKEKENVPTESKDHS